jgi:hypothetical protein
VDVGAVRAYHFRPFQSSAPIPVQEAGASRNELNRRFQNGSRSGHDATHTTSASSTVSSSSTSRLPDAQGQPQPVPCGNANNSDTTATTCGLETMEEDPSRLNAPLCRCSGGLNNLLRANVFCSHCRRRFRYAALPCNWGLARKAKPPVSRRPLLGRPAVELCSHVEGFDRVPAGSDSRCGKLKFSRK